MSGEKSRRRLDKFWWLLASILGAAAGTASTVLFGTFDTLIGIVGIGVPVGLALLTLEWSAGRKRSPERKTWTESRHLGQSPRRASVPKSPPRRGQLHAITGRKSSDPPASGTR